MQQSCARLPAVGLFTKKAEATFASAPVKAAAGASMVGNFINYTVGTDELRALSVPTISRARDLIMSMVGALELKQYTKQWTGDRYEEIYLPLEPWMERPDPKVTRSFFFGNIFSDLFMYGRAFAYVTSRYSESAGSRPASFTWLPNVNIQTPNETGPQWFGQSDTVLFNGLELDSRNVIQFIMPTEGILYTGARAINTSLYLDSAADRYAQLETVPGYLQQVEGEDLSGEDLGDLAGAWAAARKNSAIGALSRQVEFREYKTSPAEVNAGMRKFQALEMARLCSVPAYLVSAPQEGSGLTYTNVQDSNRQLYLYGARMYLDVIEQTLSADNVLPRGRFVEFDIESYIGVDTDSSMPIEPDMEDMSS